MITQNLIYLESPRKKILDLGLSVLSHPPYSANLVTCGFHLFASLQNAPNDKKDFSRKSRENALWKNS